jgi:hypothetical protein
MVMLSDRKLQVQRPRLRDPVLAQLQRRMEPAERSYYQALKQMQQIQKEEAQADQVERAQFRRVALQMELASICSERSPAKQGDPEAAPPAGDTAGSALSDPSKGKESPALNAED